MAICVDVFCPTTYSIVFKKKSTEDLTASASHVSYRCTITRQVTHKTFLVPLWLSNTLPPFPDLYFPVGHSTANPKSLPASPWRQASVEQMASVCRAAIKEEATSGEMKVGQDQGGGHEAASASSLRTDVLTCALSNAHTHTRMHVHASVHLPCKNKYPPHANHKASAVWEWKEGLGRQGKCGAQQTAPEAHTPNLSYGEKSENLLPESQIPQPNQ